jgi:hypothetical protein
MSAAHAHLLCCRDCPTALEHAAHHDRLLCVDVDPGELLALLEMAVTWHELDWSACDVAGPGDRARPRLNGGANRPHLSDSRRRAAQ